MKDSTAYVIVGLLFTVLGGALLPEMADTGMGMLVINGPLLVGGGLFLSIGVIAKGVRLGTAEREDERATERHA